MFISKLFAFVIIFSTFFGVVSSNETVNSASGKSSLNRFAYEATKSKNLIRGQYLIEGRDNMEPTDFKEHQSTNFDYLNFLASIEVKNQTNSKVVINKCCGWNRYFDVVNFKCTSLRKNLTKPYLFPNGRKNMENKSNPVFIENIPCCGKESILSVELTSRVSVSMFGATVNEEGIFSKYCIDGRSLDTHEMVALICRDSFEFCKERSCFRKCCPLGYSYGFPDRKCRKSNEPFRPDFYNLSTLTVVDSAKLSYYGIYLGDACGPKGKYLLERDLGEDSYLSVDGTLFAPSFEKQYFSKNEFCVEFVKTKNFSRMESFLCFSKTGAHFENSQLQFFLLSSGFIISCMFLLLTFLAYFFSPRIQNLYEKSLMCYIVCLFMAYLCLAIIELRSKELDKVVCRNLGYSLLFSFLAAFFWLNVMSFDIWKTFRLNRAVERSKPKRGKLMFLWYSLYAWGFPSILTGFCAYVNQVQSFPYETIKPDIGEEHCWFSKKKKGIYVFFIAPISLVIACNVIFYVQTAWKIWKVKSEVNKIEKQNLNKFSSNKDQFLINGKLFVVMGITWSLDIISYFAPHPIWYLTDAANALHGVFIFAVFVPKKRVLHRLYQEMRILLQRTRRLTRFNSDELSTRKNFKAFSNECKTSTSRISTVSKRVFKG